MSLSVATKIFAGYAVVLLTFGAVSIFSVVQMHRIGADIRLVKEGYVPLTRAAAQIETYHKNRQRELDQLLDEKDPSAQSARIRLARVYQWQFVREKLKAARQVVAQRVPGAPASELAYLAELDQRFAEVEARYGEHERATQALFSALEASDPVPAATAERLREVRSLERRLDMDIKALVGSLEQHVLARVAAAARSEARGAWAIIGLSLFAIVVGLVATAHAARTLTPVRRLTEGVTRIGRGDYSAQVPIATRDEIGVLAREFNAMAASLREREGELAEKQAALVRAERLAAIGRVTAQITHEIRNPLSSIGLNAEMLDEALREAVLAPGGEREVKELLGAIAREVDRLTEITEHYLRFAKLPKPVLEPCDVNQVVASVLDFCAGETARAGVAVERRLSAELPAVLADEGQLRQALLNLVRNAREAMVEGGALTLATQQVPGPSGGPAVEVAVTDTGRGIAAEEMQRLFEPFFTTKERGTGLGLAVTQQIVQEHGGTLKCESAPLKGTTFRLVLPAAEAREKGARLEQRAAPTASAEAGPAPR